MSKTNYNKIQRGLKCLSQESKPHRTECEKFLKIKSFTKSDSNLLREFLSDLILNPKTTIITARCFPEELLGILETLMIPRDPQNNSVKPVQDLQLHNQFCVILSKLLHVHPDVFRFCLRYFKHNPSPFHFKTQEEIQVPKKKFKPNKSYNVSDYDIVECCLAFLRYDRGQFLRIWNWSHFIEQYGYTTEERIKWLCYKCFSIIVCMSESQFRELCSKENMEIDYMFIKSEMNLNLEGPLLDCSIPHDEDNTLGPSLNKDSVSNVLDIILPKQLHNNLLITNRDLVPVQSTKNNLRSVALAIAAGRPVCLTGCVGSGKTTLVEHLASVTGSRLFKVQLGDQTDSKMLLGSYRCSDVPGEFLWGAGVLTQAVMNGHWLLLEDVDSASLDVLSMLSGLIESNKLTVPGYRDQIHVVPGFQLFLTQRLTTSATGHHKRLSSNLNSLIDKKLIYVHMETLTHLELITIVTKLYPPLATIASRMVNVYLKFSSGNHKSKETDAATAEHFCASGRLISTRDLMKWCDRASKGFDVSSPESALKIFQDAIDLFCCSVNQNVVRLKLANDIAAELGIVSTYADYYINTYKPGVKISSIELDIGRASLPRKICDSDVEPQIDFTYTFTKPSSCLLERIACCVSLNEPVLLVGETGTGKTSSVQYVASKSGHKLTVINMNQQSDSSDLLGGYKPVDMKFVISPIRREFEDVFRSFYNQDKNEKFLGYVSMVYNQSDWKSLAKMMKKCQTTAISMLKAKDKLKSSHFKQWQKLGLKIEKIESLLRSKSFLAFSFIEGSLVRAVQNGDWVLLDEINLASAETLECLSGLLEGTNGSLSLLERGDREPIVRHPDFTLFACMNPATDVGKKDLPAGLRNRFTEFFVEELTEHNDLLILIEDYLQALSPSMTFIQNLVKFYITARKEAATNLFDGTGHQPYYSLRTLCRALTIARRCVCGSLQRSLYEALCVSFLTQLDRASHPRMVSMIVKAVLGKDSAAILKQPLPELKVPCVQFVGYWVPSGNLDPIHPEGYILTESVQRNLCDLARIVSIGRLPVLLQGDTSVGKTSLITYLAKASGNKYIRINNHEHTDLQEYIGSYIANENGTLTFCEGALVLAMRFGYWIILDELNLAPSEVLEALNRVLDDNRELFIPETQTVVKAHPNFMLFATQNPPGLYGGRKVLSRAFRNRFIELHFSDIPANELQIILSQRCQVPPSYSKKMVAVMTELQLKRRGSAACAGKHGYMTLRDLFRWGERYRITSHSQTEKFYDWDQHIADEGYLVLASRVREESEKITIQEVIKKHIKRTVDEEKLFTLSPTTSTVTKDILMELEKMVVKEFPHIVWTKNLRRLMVLMTKAFQYKEPALLVGETGCGKTTVCQVLASHLGQNLKSVNCHMHSEASDFLGGLRPIRNKDENGGFFEWVDGPLINAMRNGDLFLADEISLADDSVLERLNSLLEPERKLHLAEKSAVNADSCEITAVDAFHFCATMNPSGDYGKKELSPALRNRFTEIWCESENSRSDMLDIINHNLKIDKNVKCFEVGHCILDFVDWFKKTSGNRIAISIRDILTWLDFINICTSRGLSLAECYAHGACLIFLEKLGNEGSEVLQMRKSSIEFLMKQLESFGQDVTVIKSLLSSSDAVNAEVTDRHFGIKPFYIDVKPPKYAPKNDHDMDVDDIHATTNCDFVFVAPTTGMNTLCLLRGMQLNKAVLIEGSPGVGKTSLVTALAKVTNHTLVRINLSEHTDISDLFGADLPVEGEKAGTFAWRDGPFLQALKQGHWILLDELNLAPQPVLEGLNACFDHRGEVFIPELNRTFHVEPGTRFFACQNPLHQGGARRGLPQSFLNRFVQVHIGALSACDLEFIASSQYTEIPKILIKKMVLFITKLSKSVGEQHIFGQKGSPWEFNLRDVQRWCDCLTSYSKSYKCDINAGRFVDMIFTDRMRTRDDKEEMTKLYNEVFGELHDQFPYNVDNISFYITSNKVYIGDCELMRCDRRSHSDENNLLILRSQLPLLRALGHCVNMNWMSILVGDTCTGKSSIVNLLAKLCNQDLKVISVNSAMDTTEILGGFEQTDYTRHLQEIMFTVHEQLLVVMRQCAGRENVEWLKISQKLLFIWEKLSEMMNERSGGDRESTSMSEEISLFTSCINNLNMILTTLKNLKQYHDIESSLQKSCDRLMNLQKSFESDTSLMAGGKFEWVNSMLVKCLIEGNWLLMDNVNLCSAAVLDRLNGLLEPSGELILSEQGVDAQGELLSIKPHPNFRLFLVMDPRHGEISRAMRNRGVEICILDPVDLSPQSVDILDVKSLLMNAHIQRHSLQNRLLQIHYAVSDLLPVYEKPNSGHLLHSSFLAAQQIHRGTSAPLAMTSACSDVYVKPKSDHLQPFLVEELLDKIREISENYKPDRQEIDFSSDLINYTLNTHRLNENCMMALIMQQSEVFFSLLKFSLYSTSNDVLIRLLHRVFPSSCDLIHMDLNHLLSYSIILIYQISSLSDINSRFVYIDSFLKKYSNVDTEIIILYRRINRILCDIIKESNLLINTNTSLPWDSRHGIQMPLDEFDPSTPNKILLHLYFTMMVSIEDSKQNTLTRNGMTNLKSKTITVYEYSNAVLHNQLTDSINLPIVKYYGVLLKYFDDFIERLLSDCNLSLSTTKLIDLYCALQWRFRFQRIGSMVIINKQDKNSNIVNVITELVVHYHWFMKWCLKAFQVISDLPQTESYTNFEQLQVVVSLVNSSVNNECTPLQSIRKRLNKLNRISPYSSFEQAELYFKYDTLNKMLSLWPEMDQSHINTMNSRVKILCDAEGRTKHDQLISANIELMNNNYEQVHDMLEDIEKFCSKNLQDEVLLTSKHEFKKQMWLTKDYYILHILSFVKPYILHKSSALKQLTTNDITQYEKCLSYLKDVITTQKHLPAKFINKMIYALETNNKLDLMELLTSIHEFELNYVIAVSSALQENDVRDEKLMYTKHTPLLVAIISEILRPQNKLLNGLETLQNRKIHLTNVNKLLWHNMIMLNKINIAEHDATSAIQSLRSFVIDLSICLKLNMVQDCTAEVVKACIKKISLLFSEHNENIQKRKISFIHILNKSIVVATHLEDLIKDSCEGTEKNIEMIYQTGLLNTFIGFLKITLSCSLEPMDSIQKHSLKLKYIKEEITTVSNFTLAGQLYQYVTRGNTNIDSDYYTELSDLRRKLSLKEENLSKFVAVRPVPNYSALTKECEHFANSLVSAEYVFDLIRKIENCKIALCNACFVEKQVSEEVLHSTKQLLSEISTWKYSHARFGNQIKVNFPSYPDIIQPICNSLTLFTIGIQNLEETLIKLLGRVKCKIENRDELIYHLVQFPFANINRIHFVEDIVTGKVSELLKYTSQSPDSYKQQNHSVNLIALQEIKNACINSNSVNAKQMEHLNHILNFYLHEWKAQEEAKEQTKIDQDNLYVTKVKCQEVDEVEQTFNEIQEYFPTFLDVDFADFRKDNLNNCGTNSEKNSQIELITPADIKFISTLHMELMLGFTQTEWLLPKKSDFKIDYLEPLVKRHDAFSKMMNHFMSDADSDMDVKLLTSLNLITTVMLNQLHDEVPQNKSPRVVKYDFYNDSNIDRASEALHTLHDILAVVNRQLEDWPEHPILNDIVTIVNRIINFPISSPLSRFLTGIELLRDKVEEWNKNAHRENNLKQHALELAQLIINWRKLELNSWRDCLNVAYERSESNAYKYWFHVYSLIQQYFSEAEMSLEEINKTLKHFIEKSNVSEYKIRLQIINAFHCHTIHLPQSPKQEKLSSLLWNLHSYYHQFVPYIENQLRELRTPIEKKMREFVKITSWDKNLSYWGVKDSVNKTHRTLHKHIKEFEQVLQLPVTKCLRDDGISINDNNVGIWDRPHRQLNQYQYMIEPLNYLANIKLKRLFSQDSSLFSKLAAIFNKARSICKETILLSRYPGKLQSMDIMLTDIIDTNDHYRNLEINKDLPKNKQIAQAKSILQQKRKALSDLFKYLQQLGLSYRSGLLESNMQGDNMLNFTLAPIDIKVSFGYFKTKKCDGPLLTVWDGCEKYYFRSIARYAALQNVMKMPAPDLGLPNIDRCKGFATNMLLLAQSQKEKIISNSGSLLILRSQIDYISTFEELEFCPKQSFLNHHTATLSEILVLIITTLTQYKLILNSIPDSDNIPTTTETDIFFDDVCSTASINRISRNDSDWLEINARFTNIITNTEKILNIFKKNLNRLPINIQNTFKSMNFKNPSSYQSLLEGYTHAKSVSEQLFELCAKLETSDNSHPALVNLHSLVNTIEEKHKFFHQDMENIQKEICVDRELQNTFNGEIEKLINRVQISIQNIYKKYKETIPIQDDNQTKDATSATENGEKEEDQNLTGVSDIEKNHLTKIIENALSEDISILNLNQVCRLVEHVLLEATAVQEKNNDNYNWLRWTLLPCVPLLEQLMLLAEFYITQQIATHRITCKMLSILLNIFNELGLKGFCVPPEFSDEVQGDGKECNGGMGLGDGEGEKDVSERIENEDQLQDAHKEGQEPKQEDDKDCDEEDNGIEMSDDFDGKLQDVKKNDEENDSDNEDDDEDADKQMGDTEDTSDQLDQQIWGGDEQEENADENEEQGKDGNGQETGEKEMSTCEKENERAGEQQNPEARDDEEESKNQKKEINDMQEPDENDDQINPYHGEMEPPPEPEPLDLPDDMQLDDGDGMKEDENVTEDNPFDIDAMKEQIEPPDDELNTDKNENKDEEDGKNQSDSSDDEDNCTQDKDNVEQVEETEETEETEDLPSESQPEIKSNDVEKDQEKDAEMQENKEESDKKQNDNAEASRDKSSQQPETEGMETEEQCSTDQTQSHVKSQDLLATDDKQKPLENPEESKKGDGQAQEEQPEQDGTLQDNMSNVTQSGERNEDFKKNLKKEMAKSKDTRTLGDNSESFERNLKTIDVNQTEKERKQEEDAASEKSVKQAELCKHVENAKDSDTQVMDTATPEQIENNLVKLEEETNEVSAEDEVAMDVDGELPEVPEQMHEDLQAEKNESTDKRKPESTNKKNDHCKQDMDTEVNNEVEGEKVLTHTVQRENENKYITSDDVLHDDFNKEESLTIAQMEEMKLSVEQSSLSSLSRKHIVGETDWEKLWWRTSSQARDLCEQLRLLLEPTLSTRLKGDYKTGRRINMRKVVPYVASEFRKDKIWLRRTLPSKREYKIIISIDDSSSMCGNQSTEMACESVALVSQALTLLEAGDLAVLSFGETPKILHDFQEPFTPQSGSRIMSELTFQQNKSRFAKLLDFAGAMFMKNGRSNSAAELLIIVSDGCISSENNEVVRQAVRRLRQAGVFIVFLIVDNVKNNCSMVDTRVPVFNEKQQLIAMNWAMDVFPFPFYLFLRNLTSLPAVLSDALRQWFDLTSKTMT